MHKVAHDRDFLKQTLTSIIQVDDFTARLFKIWEQVTSEGITQVLYFITVYKRADIYTFWQPLSLGLVRNDLMLDSLKSWKQVEFNTIAAGFGWLGPASLAINR